MVLAMLLLLSLRVNSTLAGKADKYSKAVAYDQGFTIPLEVRPRAKSAIACAAECRKGNANPKKPLCNSISFANSVCKIGLYETGYDPEPSDDMVEEPVWSVSGSHGMDLALAVGGNDPSDAIVIVDEANVLNANGVQCASHGLPGMGAVQQRYGSMVVYKGKKIFLLGGKHAGVPVAQNNLLDLTQSTWVWEAKEPMNHYRTVFAALVYEGKIFVFAGTHGSSLPVLAATTKYAGPTFSVKVSDERAWIFSYNFTQEFNLESEQMEDTAIPLLPDHANAYLDVVFTFDGNDGARTVYIFGRDKNELYSLSVDNPAAQWTVTQGTAILPLSAQDSVEAFAFAPQQVLLQTTDVGSGSHRFYFFDEKLGKFDPADPAGENPNWLPRDRTRYSDNLLSRRYFPNCP